MTIQWWICPLLQDLTFTSCICQSTICLILPQFQHETISRIFCMPLLLCNRSRKGKVDLFHARALVCWKDSVCDHGYIAYSRRVRSSVGGTGRGLGLTRETGHRMDGRGPQCCFYWAHWAGAATITLAPPPS